MQRLVATRSSPAGRPFPLLLAVFVVLLPASASAGEVDTFYQRLLDDGIRLAAAGDGSAAAKLRLACFGLLDAPPMLGPCLGHLLVAQKAGGAQDDELEATVDRLLEVEKLFRGWSEPLALYAPPADLRRRVDTLIVRFGTAENLARIPALADLARQKQAEQVAALPGEERRKQLNLLVQRQASIPLWHVMNAELSLELGDLRAAARAADEILRKFDGHAPARCVRGRAHAGLGECNAVTIEDLDLCPAEHPQRLDIDTSLLTCLVAVGRWREADELLGRLPAAQRDEREIRKLERRLEKLRESDAEPPPSSAAASAGGAAESAEPRGGAAGHGGDTRAPQAAAIRSDQAPVFVPPPGTDGRQSPVVEPTEFAGLPDADREVLLRARDALATEHRDLYAGLWPAVRKVAKRHDDSPVAQRLAGSLAFRLGRWRDAARFLRRDQALAGSRPDLQLDLALALHYLGERDEAQREFARCRERLAASAWVEFWAGELGAGA